MRIFLAVATAALFCQRVMAADACYRIGTVAGAGATGEIAVATQQAFQQAGLCATTMRLPPNRINGMIEHDEIDGWAMAYQMAVEDLSGLVAVPTPLAVFAGTLFWPSGRPEPKGPHAILGAVIGQDWADREIAQRRARLFEVRDNRQLFQMTLNGRLQGFVMPVETFQHFRRDYPDLKGFQSRQVAFLPVTIVLQRRHEKILAPLDEGVRKLKQSGFIDQLLETYKGGK